MKSFLLAGGVFALLAVGVFAIAGAAAQEDEPDVRPVDHYLEVLAGNLGISVEELEAALTQSHIDIINEKVTDGTLSEEDAAEIIERIESGEGRLFPPFGPRHHQHRPFHRLFGLVLHNSAEVLDMEVEALKEELHDGNSLADVATAQGMEVETFKSELLAAIEADLDAKVAEGEISQETADDVLAKITESIDRIVDKVPGEDGPGGDRRFGGPRFGGPGFKAPLGGTDGAGATEAIFLN